LSRPDTLHIASAQYPIDEPRSQAEWRDKIVRWVKDGAATGADILVFPEYAAIEQAATFGRDVAGNLEASLKAVADLERERAAFHRELAAEHKVHILAGSGPARRDGSRFVNAAHLVTPTGSIGVQEKRIMTPFEWDWGISPGGPLRVFDTVLGRIGIAICYDSEFPLLVRAMAEAGAELVLVPSCTERVSGYHRVRTAARARALENQIVTVTSPTIGEALWSPAVDHNVGAAGIYVPSEHMISNDGSLSEGTLNEPGWVTAQANLARLERLRGEGEMRNYVDWANQPGAAVLKEKVEVVTLR
jgi:predicted amidohydrolase